MKEPRIEIVHRGARAWLVRVFGTNGEQLSVSELLTSKQAAYTNLLAQGEIFTSWALKCVRTQFKDERTPRRRTRSRKP